MSSSDQDALAIGELAGRRRLQRGVDWDMKFVPGLRSLSLIISACMTFVIFVTYTGRAFDVDESQCPLQH